MPVKTSGNLGRLFIHSPEAQYEGILPAALEVVPENIAEFAKIIDRMTGDNTKKLDKREVEILEQTAKDVKAAKALLAQVGGFSPQKIFDRQNAPEDFPRELSSRARTAAMLLEEPRNIKTVMI